MTKSIKITSEEYLVSFDVTSLYPNVPMKCTLNIIKEWLISIDLTQDEIKEYIMLTDLCMSQTTFQFENQFYQQIEGTAMGNPLSCFIANIFLAKFELNAKQNMTYFPRVWLRYVDDIFAIFNKNQDLQNFINQLNTFYPTIKFTCEIETNSSLPFLDVLVKRNNGDIEYDIYRKPTCNNRYIPHDSNHPPSQKRAAFHTMINRLLTTPLKHDEYMKEIINIKSIAAFNGYSTKLIDSLLKKQKKNLSKTSKTTLKSEQKEKRNWQSMSYGPFYKEIKKVFRKHQDINITFYTPYKINNLIGNPKDKILDENKSGIYKINCEDCDKIYIGQTKRTIKKRFKEHERYYKYGQTDKSAIAKHAFETNHTFKNFTLLKEVHKQEELDAYETLYITKHKDTILNNDFGPIQNSPFLKI
ncbi:hypothetical protein J6590_108521 [Homalodisca vitripennis]|nr:hypothetical protein J6590_108521 [Homalodisca vitripennis]